MAALPQPNGLPQLIQRLAELEAAIINSMEELAKELALNAKAFAERTILEKGVGEYSTNPLPAFWFEGEELNRRGATFIAKRKAQRKGLYWAELRKEQGLQTAFIDLHYSNKMFSGMGVKAVERRGTFFYGVLGHNSKEGQDKMNWNRDRFGDFIEMGLGEDGRRFLSQLAKNRIITIMRNFQL